MQKTFKKSSEIKTVLISGFIAGMLDILAAFFVYSVVMKVVTPMQILRGIAAGAFGKTIIGSEVLTALPGLLFHFIIAYIFAIIYFFIYPRIKILHHNTIVNGLLYGIFVWAIMNLIVLPLSHAYHVPFAFYSFLRAIIILMLCVGLPISIITSKYYNDKAINSE